MTKDSSFEDTLKFLEIRDILSALRTRFKEKCELWDLARRAGAGAIVEIGSFEGYSTIILAKGLGGDGCVYAIDPHTSKTCETDQDELPSRDTWVRFKKNIQDAGISQLVRPIKLKSEEAVVSWNRPIRILWIDGSHRYEDVKKDFLLWHRYLVPGGIVLFHDCWIAGVRKVIVEHLLSNSLFGELKFTPPSMFRATYLGKEHRHVLQSTIWRFLFWLRSIIKENRTSKKWLASLLARFGNR